MNSLQFDPDAPLVDLVSFKWLMAGHGWWVDVARLRNDADYARLCARRGAESGLDVIWRPSVDGRLGGATGTLRHA